MSKNRYKGRHWSSDFDHLPKKGFVWYLSYLHKAGKDKWPLSVFEVDSVVNEFPSEFIRIPFWAPIEDLHNPPHFDRFAIEGLLWKSRNSNIVVQSTGKTVSFDSFSGIAVLRDLPPCSGKEEDNWVKIHFKPISQEEFEAIQKPKIKNWRDAELEYLGNKPDLVWVVPTENFVHYVINSATKVTVKSLEKGFLNNRLKRFRYACAIQITEKYPKEEIDQETLDIAQS